MSQADDDAAHLRSREARQKIARVGIARVRRYLRATTHRQLRSVAAELYVLLAVLHLARRQERPVLRLAPPEQRRGCL